MSLYLEIPEINPLFPFKTFTNEGWSITYPHWHKEIEFIYCLEGTVRLGVDDEIIQMHVDEIYFFLVVNRTSSCLRQIVNESFINLISNSFKGMTISRQMIVHWPKYLRPSSITVKIGLPRSKKRSRLSCFLFIMKTRNSVKGINTVF